MNSVRLAWREVLLAVIAMLGLLPFPSMAMLTLWLSFGGDTGWGENTPDLKSITMLASMAALPLLQIAGPVVAWITRNRWTFIARLLCVLAPFVYWLVLLSNPFKA